MAAPKKDPMEVKIPKSYGIRKKVAIAFENKCKKLGLSASNVVESLMEQFLN